MLISRKTVKPLHPPLKMNNHVIREASSHKNVGFYFSDNGSWHEHIDYIVKKSFVRLNILRRFLLVLDRITLEKMYFSFKRPILEYGDVIWDSNIQYL
jgi:NDP-sugar pyrophosphorylase family protein